MQQSIEQVGDVMQQSIEQVGDVIQQFIEHVGDNILCSSLLNRCRSTGTEC